MSSSALSFHSIAQSNLPTSQKSALARMYEGFRSGGPRALSRVKSHAVSAGSAIRQGGESVAVGGLLALAQVELPQGLDIHGKYPIDGVVGVLGLAGSVLLANEEVSTDLRNAGSTALGILTFRKSHDWLEAKKKARQAGGAPPATAAKVAGDDWEVGADPIAAAAKLLSRR